MSKQIFELSEKVERFLNAMDVFGTRYYGDNAQTQKDHKFMQRKYVQGGRFLQGRRHAQRSMYAKIFNTPTPKTVTPKITKKDDKKSGKRCHSFWARECANRRAECHRCTKFY